jgi:hypothetical protein
MANKIFPRNLTARAEREVTGNPVTSRFESGVANCFPGLEFDLRNLDNRFFPGLFFHVITKPLAPVIGSLPNLQGVKLAYLDFLEDQMLPMNSREQWVQDLIAAYLGPTGDKLSSGRWYLEWIEHENRRISMYDADHTPLDGETVWALIRSLEPGSLITICLARRNELGNTVPPEIQLRGCRRKYVNSQGVFDSVYRPGELTETMCNPWTHDFRDCGCHYWASNHPDVVLGEMDPDEAASASSGSAPIRPALLLDWSRSDRRPSGRVAAAASLWENRPFQLDHFEINHRWEELAFVVEGREIGNVYGRATRPDAPPYRDAQEMIDELKRDLAPMELALAFEYLYALFSLRTPEEAPQAVWPTMAGDLESVRQILTVIAIGEMTHLRWANQLLWQLYNYGMNQDGEEYEPVLTPANTISLGPGQLRSRQLRPLTIDVLEEFARIERPGGALDTAYARCVSTLRNRDNYPIDLFELAVRIDTDGVQHYRQFQEARRILNTYAAATDPQYPYLRDITLGSYSQTSVALGIRDAILNNLSQAFSNEAQEQFSQAELSISQAREMMGKFHDEAEMLARNGIGIPFW